MLKIYRDVWALGPPNNGYPGAFPQGLISRIQKRWWGRKRLWLFSGSFKDGGGTTLDCNSEVKADFTCNAEELPFADGAYDFVMADPPYSEQEAKKLYGTKYPSMVKVLNEMARVCCEGGHVILLHRLVPMVHPQLSKEFKKLELVGIVGVHTIAGFTNMRALCVWRKRNTLRGG